MGFSHYNYYCLLTREMNDILEGYTGRLKREEDNLILHIKVARKNAFMCILPHIKNMSEMEFNRDFWPVDEKQPTEDFKKEQIKNMQQLLKEHNQKLSEARRKKANIKKS